MNPNPDFSREARHLVGLHGAMSYEEMETSIASALRTAVLAERQRVWRKALEAVPEKSMECSQDNKPGMHYECDCSEKDTHNAARVSLLRTSESEGVTVG